MDIKIKVGIIVINDDENILLIKERSKVKNILLMKIL